MRVEQVEIDDPELEQMAGDVGIGLGLDDPAPDDRIDTLRADLHAEAQMAVGLEQHAALAARERGMPGGQEVALAGALPQDGAAVVGEELLLHRGSERGVVDRYRQRDDSAGGSVGARDCGHRQHRDHQPSKPPPHLVSRSFLRFTCM